MGLKKYEQEIAAAVSHPDRDHAVTVLESLARSLRRHEWPPERRGAAYDLADRSEAEAKRLAQPTMDRAAAQEIADREGYSVHVECGGEVTPRRISVVMVVAHHECHVCDRDVIESEVVDPQE